MSFVRPAGKGKPSKPIHRVMANLKKKPVKKKKPDWDATTQDLTVHKASPEEIARRKAAHLSSNVEAVRADKFKKRIAKARKERTPGSARKVKASILREVLYNESQLSDVLIKSDKVMAAVQDLFGDDPKRFRGLPNVTIAPGKTEENFDQSILKSTTIAEPSQLDTLSESVMDKSALNDEDIVGQLIYSTEESETEEPDPITYQPKLDLSCFHRLLQQEIDQKQELKPPGSSYIKATTANKANPNVEYPNLVEAVLKKFETSPHDGSYLDEPSTPVAPTSGAMNDTEKVQKTRSRLQQESGESHTDGEVNQEQHMNMQDLKKVLDGLETNIASYERLSGKQPAASRLTPNTFTGYTQALVDAVNRLTGYLVESERRLQAESMLREQLSQDLTYLQTCVDALTMDIITNQEDYANLDSQFRRYRDTTDRQLRLVYDRLGLKLEDPATARVPGHTVGSGRPSHLPQPLPIPTQSLDLTKGLDQPGRHALLLTPPRQMDSPRSDRAGSRNNPPAFHEENRQSGSIFQHQVAAHSSAFTGTNIVNTNLATESNCLEPTPTLNNVHPDVRKNILQAAKSYAQQQGAAYRQRADAGVDIERQEVGMAMGGRVMPHHQQPQQGISSQNDQAWLASRHQDLINRLQPSRIADVEGTTESVATETCRSLLERQLQELNKKHAEAQVKMQQLLAQQQQHQQATAMLKESSGAPVSPPISPIPPESAVTSGTVNQERQRIEQQREGMTRLGLQKQGITVALPTVEWSTGLSPASPDDRPSSRRSSSSPMTKRIQGQGHMPSGVTVQ